MGSVVAVSVSGRHDFSKANVHEIELLEGLGVAGDAHCGATVKHRSRVAQNPDQPNLRQVHLIHSELFQDVADQGFQISPGQLGENITTVGIDLLGLPTDTILDFSSGASVKVTGLRNPCAQIDKFQTGLLRAVLEKNEDGTVVRKSGIMGVVLKGGRVAPGDSISVRLPDEPHRPLERV